MSSNCRCGEIAVLIDDTPESGDTTYSLPTEPEPELRPAAPSLEPLDDPRVSGFPPEVQRSVLSTEERIRHETTEHAVIVDGNGKELINKTDGNASRVSFTLEQIEQIAKDGTATLMHNHPRSTALSDDDRIMAGRMNLREMRAVGSDGTVYRIVRPEGGWPGYEKMLNYQPVAEVRTWQRGMDSIDQGNMTRETFNHEGHHIENQVFAEHFKYQYERIRPNA